MAFLFFRRREVSGAASAEAGGPEAGQVAKVAEASTGPHPTPGTRRPVGQVDPFEAEVLALLDVLYAAGLRMSRSATEADDLVQDTVLKALKARAQFQQGTSLKAWLLRILTNTFLTRRRRGGLERDLLEGPDAAPLLEAWTGASSLRSARDAEGLALSPLLEAELQRALDALPSDYRAAVILSDIEELSYKEIAEALGCPIGTVMSRLHRARKLLQGSLQEHAKELGLVAGGARPSARTEPSASRATPTTHAPADLAAFRQKKQARTA